MTKDFPEKLSEAISVARKELARKGLRAVQTDTAIKAIDAANMKAYAVLQKASRA